MVQRGSKSLERFLKQASPKDKTGAIKAAPKRPKASKKASEGESDGGGRASKD